MNDKTVENQYNSMSYFYDVLYSGCALREYEDAFIDEFRSLLNNLPPGAKILDSSCGNGIQATALKRNGFDVIGTDISEEMIRLTRQYSNDNNLPFPTEQLSWADLSERFMEEFDLVFCYGNSISHSSDKEDMLNNIRSLSSVMKKGGKIVFETRNWDKVINNNVRFNTSGIKKYLDKTYVHTYIWNLNGFDEHCSVEILFIDITDENETKCIPFRLAFTPFKHDEFIDRLRSSGLQIVYDNFQLINDNYFVILEK